MYRGEWNKFVLVTAQNTYQNKHTVLQLHFNNFNVCIMMPYKF